MGMHQHLEISFNAVQNNTSLKPVLVTFKKLLSFNAVQNNTSLKQPVIVTVRVSRF